MHVGFHTLFFFMETRLTIPHFLLVGMQTGTATIENGIEVHQKINKRVNLKPTNSFSEYLPENFENICAKIYAPLCSLQHDSQWPRHENNQSVLR